MSTHRAPPELAALADAVIGSWALESFEIHYADGRPPSAPFGPEARGRIVYAASGFMAAVLSRGDRGGAAEAALETAARLAPEAKQAAFDGYLSYSGRWRLERGADGPELVHALDLALLPGAVGTEQRRRLALDGDRLELTYHLTPASGVTRRYALRWRREAEENGR